MVRDYAPDVVAGLVVRRLREIEARMNVTLQREAH